MGTVDDYLVELTSTDAAAAAAIVQVYAVMRDEAPDAEQGLGYGMPAYTFKGKPLLSVMRAAKHIGLYPFSPAAVAEVADAVAAVEGTSTAKGTIRFSVTHPLPDELVRALVRTRLAQIVHA